MVKTKNKYNALVDGYFAKLEDPNNEKEIVQLFREHERAKFVELTKKKGEFERDFSIAKEQVDVLENRKSIGIFGEELRQEEELRKNKEIVEKYPGIIEQTAAALKEIKDRLDDETTFADRALQCKTEYKSYQELTELMKDLAGTLDEEESKEIQIRAQKAKFWSTVVLKNYLREQVRPDLLTCPGANLARAPVHISCILVAMHVNACVMSAIMDATPSCAGVSAPWRACESICACPAAPKQVPLCPGLCAGQDFRLAGRLHDQGLASYRQQLRRALPDLRDYVHHLQPRLTRPSADRWHDLHGCPTLSRCSARFRN
jgi:hypothetical protein